MRSPGGRITILIWASSPYLTELDLEKSCLSFGHPRKYLVAVAKVRPAAAPSKISSPQQPEPAGLPAPAPERRQLTVFIESIVKYEGLSRDCILAYFGFPARNRTVPRAQSESVVKSRRRSES